MRRFVLPVIALLMGISGFTPALAQGAGHLKKITVLANYTFHGRHTPFFVALDKGYFKEAGFDADIQPATGSGFVISAIESGKATYGLADASTAMQAIAKGAKIKGFQVFMDVVTNGIAALKPYPTPNRSLATASPRRRPTLRERSFRSCSSRKVSIRLRSIGSRRRRPPTSRSCSAVRPISSARP